MRKPFSRHVQVIGCFRDMTSLGPFVGMLSLDRSDQLELAIWVYGWRGFDPSVESFG